MHDQNPPLASRSTDSAPWALRSLHAGARWLLPFALLGCSLGVQAAGAGVRVGNELWLTLADFASAPRGPLAGAPVGKELRPTLTDFASAPRGPLAGAPADKELRLTLADLASAPRGPLAGTPAGKELRLGLADTIRLALDNNRDLDNARIGRILERYDVEIAKNEFRPAFALNSGAQRSGVPGARPADSTQVSTSAQLRVRTGGQFALSWSGSGSEPYSQSLNLTFTQPLLRGAGVKVATAGLANARRGEEQNLLAFQDTVARVVSSVVRLYRAYGQAQRNVEALDRAMTRARERYETNRFLVDAGRMAEQELVQNRAELKQREFGIVAAKNGLDAARLALVRALDVDNDSRFVLTETLDPGDVPPPADTEASLKLALENRIDYHLARLAIEAAEQNLLIARNRRRWDLSLSVGTSLASTGSGIGRTARGLDLGAYSIGLSLNVPLGRVADDPLKLGHLAAAIALERARTQYEDLRHAIEVDVLDAVRTVQTSHQQLLLARETRALSEETVDIERTKLASGLSSNFEMVATEDALLAATNQEIDAAIGYLNSLTALDEILGTTLATWGIDVSQVERAETGLEFEPEDRSLRLLLLPVLD